MQYKAIAVCGNGCGTSLVLHMSADKAIKELGIGDRLKVEHADLGSAKAMPCDFFIITDDMIPMFESQKRRYVSVKTAFDPKALMKCLPGMIEQLDEERK